MGRLIPLQELKVSINLNNNPKAGSYHPATKLTEHITRTAWSPIVFKDHKRLEANFDFSDWAVLDFDTGLTLGQALDIFCDCIHIIGTTKSHTPEAHRFRVCVPWEARITDINTFKYNMKTIVERYDADQQCKDGARFYFPCKEIISVSSVGYRMEVKPAPSASTNEKLNYKKTGFSSAVTFFMKNIIVPTHNGHNHRNTQLYQVSKDLFRLGLLPETIEDIILKSPTYRDTALTADLSREIKEVMLSARKSVENERA